MRLIVQHTCGGPVFGKLTPGCPRCKQLEQGATPVRGYNKTREQQEMERIAEIRRHDCKTAGCGPICTHGDW